MQNTFTFNTKSLELLYIYILVKGHLENTNRASHTSAVQVELPGSCSVVVVGSGSAAAKTAAAVVANEHSWSPSVARSSHLSDQVEYIDDTSIFSPLA